VRRVLLVSSDRELSEGLVSSGLSGGSLRVVSSCSRLGDLPGAVSTDLDAVLVDEDVVRSREQASKVLEACRGLPVYLLVGSGGDPVEVWRRARAAGFAGVAPRSGDAFLVAQALDGVRPAAGAAPQVPGGAVPAAGVAARAVPEAVPAGGPGAAFPPRGEAAVRPAPPEVGAERRVTPVAAGPLDRALGWRGGGAEEPAGERVLVAKQEVVCVFSPKGGVGKTALATNLAAALRPAGVRLRVCLVDFDVERSGVARALGLPQSVSLVDWAELPSESADVVREYTVEYRPGLRVLPAPLRFEDALRVGVELAERVIDLARRAFDVVVLDTGGSLKEDVAVVCLERATRVIVPCTLEAPSMSMVVDAQRVLAQLGVLDRALLVVNQAPRNPQVSLEDVRRYLREDFVRWPRVIPYDAQARSVMARCELPVLVAPSCPFAREVRALASELVPVLEARPRGLLGRLFRR